jgi:hypothetical protein
MLSQQKTSRFASKVTRDTVSGATVAFYDLLGLAEGEEITTRHPDTPINEIPNTRRRVSLTGMHVNTPLDHLDKLQMMIDPQNKYTVAQARWAGRTFDDRIIAAMVGTAQAGVDGGTAVTFANDSLSINGDGTVTSLGTGAVPGVEVDMSLAKMLLMLQIFNQEDVDPDIPRYWAVNPKSISDMLALTQIGSSDYNTVKALQEGKVEDYMGFNFFWSNRILKNTSDETCYRSLAWSQEGVIFASWEDVTNRVSERADKSYMIQVYSRFTNGAVRLEGAQVHECLNKVA